MTARGRAVFGLGIACWVAAVVFGSRALYPVAAGLFLAVLLALVWVRVTLGQPRISRRWAHEGLCERGDVAVELVLEREPGMLLPGVLARERIGRLAEQDVELRPRGHGRHTGSYVLHDVPRGRHAFSPVRLSISDPFGLAETRVMLDERQSLVVYPRLTKLDRLFFDGGTGREHGRRLVLRRPVGFDLHSVRDYQQGESLRRVHWPSTARRGALMVKELEDSPRDEVAVLLDGDAAAVAGSPPDSSFDAAVRVAGSILLAQIRLGRRCVLALNTAGRAMQTVSSHGHDWQLALELLAAAEPDATRPAAELLEPSVSPATRSAELVVVTSRIESALVNRLVERVLTHRAAALVHVEAASFAGRPHRPEPALLRLQAAGVAIAVVRRGDDLEATLGRVGVGEAAHA